MDPSSGIRSSQSPWLILKENVIAEMLRFSGVLSSIPGGKSDSKLEHIPAFIMREEGN